MTHDELLPVTAAVLVVGSPANRTNMALVARWRLLGLRAALLSAPAAERAASAGDVVLGRLDVLPGLDGVEHGLEALRRLERSGVTVRNRADALLTVHDKLLTAERLAGAGLHHPLTRAWEGTGAAPLAPPVVLKPRFGSWGRDVFRCDDETQLARAIEAVRDRRWFRRHGVLLQVLIPPTGFDLRLVVAGGEVVGASERVSGPGEWRTNVSLGGSLRPADPPETATSLAVSAAAAVGVDLVGVDLLPVGDGFTVLELNGAVDFDQRYALRGGDVYVDVAASLGLVASAPADAADRGPRRMTNP